MDEGIAFHDKGQYQEAIGNDGVFGGNGNDDVNGALGDDRVDGNSGDDLVSGGEGNDTVLGSSGDDILLGQDGDDVLRGGKDDDILIDGSGTDDFHGSLGDDLIIASGFGVSESAAQDLFENPDPTLDTAGTIARLGLDFSQDTDLDGDVVNAGYGADTIFGGIGDTLTGGEGADTFVTGEWVVGQDATVITDFAADEDVLLYSYDDTQTEPVLTSVAEDNADGGSDAIVMADGVEVIRLVGLGATFDVTEDIALVPYN